MCHFRDVVKRLTYIGMKEINEDFSPNGISIKQLRTVNLQWQEKYPDLKTKTCHEFNCGKVLAAQYLSKWRKNTLLNKKM